MHPAPHQIEVVSWEDLADLPDVMDQLTQQVAEVVGHARRWVCSTEGFEPSPVCVLRPLVPVMHHVAEAFAEVEAALRRELGEIGAAVATSYGGLLGADVGARTALAEDVPTC